MCYSISQFFCCKYFFFHVFFLSSFYLLVSFGRLYDVFSLCCVNMCMVWVWLGIYCEITNRRYKTQAEKKIKRNNNSNKIEHNQFISESIWFRIYRIDRDGVKKEDRRKDRSRERKRERGNEIY